MQLVIWLKAPRRVVLKERRSIIHPVKKVSLRTIIQSPILATSRLTLTVPIV